MSRILIHEGDVELASIVGTPPSLGDTVVISTHKFPEGRIYNVVNRQQRIQVTPAHQKEVWTVEVKDMGTAHLTPEKS